MANCFNDCIHSFVCQYANHDEYPSAQQLKDDCRYCKFGIDVAPKSEVDRLVDKWIGSGELTPNEKTLRLIEALRDEAKRYERYYFNHEYDKLIAEAKAEVAREIFDEIESELMVTIDPIFFDGMARIWVDDFCELKKKYTEEKL